MGNQTNHSDRQREREKIKRKCIPLPSIKEKVLRGISSRIQHTPQAKICVS